MSAAVEQVIRVYKTKLYTDSFIPSATQLWNTLPETIQVNPSVSLLRKHLSLNDTLVPVYYYFGSRKEQVVFGVVVFTISRVTPLHSIWRKVVLIAGLGCYWAKRQPKDDVF